MKYIFAILISFAFLNTNAQKDYKRLNVSRDRSFNLQAKIFIEPIIADYVMAIPLLKNSLQKDGFTVVDDKSKADYSVTMKYKSRNDKGCDGRVIAHMEGFITDLKGNFEAAKFTFGQSKLEGKCTDKVMDSLVHKLKTGED